MAHVIYENNTSSKGFDSTVFFFFNNECLHKTRNTKITQCMKMYAFLQDVVMNKPIVEITSFGPRRTMRKHGLVCHNGRRQTRLHWPHAKRYLNWTNYGGYPRGCSGTPDKTTRKLQFQDCTRENTCEYWRLRKRIRRIPQLLHSRRDARQCYNVHQQNVR